MGKLRVAREPLVQVPAQPLLTAAALVDEIVAMHDQQLQLAEAFFARPGPIEVRRRRSIGEFHLDAEREPTNTSAHVFWRARELAHAMLLAVPVQKRSRSRRRRAGGSVAARGDTAWR